MKSRRGPSFLMLVLPICEFQLKFVNWGMSI